MKHFKHNDLYIPKALFITIFALVIAVLSPRSEALAQRSGGTAPKPTNKPRITATPTPTQVTGLLDGQIDIDDDGDVDIFDYNVLVSQFGWTGPSAGNVADFNDDGFVNTADLDIFMIGYGVIAPQWATSQSAVTLCLPNGTVGINVAFRNTESNPNLSMDVLATDTQTGSSLDLGTVPPQFEATGTIQTGVTSLSAGVVVFDLAWTNGDPRVDQRFASYNAISCTPITNTPTSTPTSTLTPTPTTTTTTTPTPTSPLTPTPTSVPLSCVSGYQTIGFSNMNGVTNVEGNVVSNQYQGVTFSLENCSTTSPKVAKTGAPLRAFAYNKTLPDQAAVGETFGQYFITDSGFFGADDPICTMVIDYLPNYRTSSVHLDLLDVDGFVNNSGTAIYERFNITAYDVNGTQVASQEVLRSDATYDGKALRVNILSQASGGLVGAPKPAIAKVKISGTSNR